MSKFKATRKKKHFNVLFSDGEVNKENRNYQLIIRMFGK